MVSKGFTRNHREIEIEILTTCTTLGEEYMASRDLKGTHTSKSCMGRSRQSVDRGAGPQGHTLLLGSVVESLGVPWLKARLVNSNQKVGPIRHQGPNNQAISLHSQRGVFQPIRLCQ